MIVPSFRSFLVLLALLLNGVACHHAELELPLGVAGNSGASASAGEANFGGAAGEVGSADAGGDAGAGDAGAGDAGVAPYHMPPRVLSVTPADAATGVLKDTNVVIQFSAPMNQALTVKAVHAMLGSDVQVTWGRDGTQLTLDPKQDLSYATGSTAVAVEPLQYSVSIASSAADLAGNPLDSAFAISFHTACELTVNMTQDDSLGGWVTDSGDPTDMSKFVRPWIGDDLSDYPMRGFVSFDLKRLPDTLEAITQATLTVTQHDVQGEPFSLGALELDHVSFAALGLEAYKAEAVPSYGPLFAELTTEPVSVDVTATVRADFAAGPADTIRSQFRFAFESGSNMDGTSDTLILYPISLRVSYLVP